MNFFLRSLVPKLRRKKFINLRWFFSDFCDEESIKECATIDHIIDLLKKHAKICIFNIDALNASCKHFGNSKVTESLKQYRQQLDHFLSNTSVEEFKGALMKIDDSSKVETITIKLDESRTEDTLKTLRKLINDFFGIHQKAVFHYRTDEGCVCVTWVVTTMLVPILREKAEQPTNDTIQIHVHIVVGRFFQGMNSITLRL